ncbi:MAG: hypothetical protein WC686_02080 [Candidatus Shapirobacteria bacterium]|jgi:hypothetical protein
MNEEIIEVNIAKDFTLTPGARYRTDGKFSGEEFYEDVLKARIDEVWSKDNSKLIVYLDGTYGYASSFLSEVSIRIVKDFIDKKKILEKINFVSEKDPLIVEAIVKFINETP